MNIQEYNNCKKEIQEKLLILLDDNDDNEKNFRNFMKCVDDQKILDDENEFRSLNHLLNWISMNHYREPNFLNKINQIIIHFKDAYKQFFTNKDLIIFFMPNKQILLMLIENGILQIDESVALHIIEKASFLTQCFFFNEIKDFVDEQKINKIEAEILSNNANISFIEKRHLGENESYLCELIRKDSVQEFIAYVNRINLNLSSQINKSIFETNQFLDDNQPTLIEYAAFYGSFQIFQFLFRNNVEMTSSLWLYSIHGRNPEIIHLLEEMNVKPEDETYHKCLIESIICHHNNIADYFINNYVDDSTDTLITNGLLYYNFYFIPNILPYDSYDYSCSSDYYFLTKQFLNDPEFFRNTFIKYINCKTNITTSVLFCAINNNNLNIVKLLLSYRKVLRNLYCFNYELSNFEQKYDAYYAAISQNNTKMFQFLFNFKKPDINFKIVSKTYATNANYIIVREFSPLLDAINCKNLDIIKIFLQDPSFDTNFGIRTSLFSSDQIDWNTNNHVYHERPLLHYAIEKGFIEIVELLLTNPYIQINKKYVDTLSNIEESALYLAIKTKNINIIRLLLSNSEINVNEKSKCKIDEYEYYETPLYQAIREQNNEIIQMLLNHPKIKINKKSTRSSFYESKKLKEKIEETVLHLAIRMKNKEMIQLLMSKQIDVNKKYVKNIYEENSKSVNEQNTALNLAILGEDIEIISILASCPTIDFNLKGISYISDLKFEWSPLTLAIYRDQTEIINIILSHDNTNINTEILISKPFVYSKRQSALYLALDKGNEKVVKKILTNPNINVNYTSSYISSENGDIKEKTLLHLAFEKGNDEIIKSLLSFPNLNLNLRSKYRSSDKEHIKEYQETTFTCGIKHGNTEIMNIILSNPNFDACLESYNINIDNNNVSHIACNIYKTAIQYNNIEIFKILLEYAYDHGFSVLEIDELSELTNDQRIKDTLIDFLNQKKSN